MKVHVEENTFTVLYPARIAGSVGPDTRISAFEQQVATQLVDASNHLRDEEFDLALDAYLELAALLVNIVNPAVPPSVWTTPSFMPPRDPAILQALADAAGRLLPSSPPPGDPLPVVGLPATVSDAVKKATERFASTGLSAPPAGPLAASVADAERAAQAGKFAEAVRLYTAAARLAGNDTALAADIAEDLQLVTREASRSPAHPTGAPAPGAAAPAAGAAAPVAAAPIATAPAAATHTLVPPVLTGTKQVQLATAVVSIPRSEELPLRAGARIASRAQVRQFVLIGAQDRVAIDLPAPGDDAPGKVIVQLLEARRASKDLGVITGFMQSPATTTAFLPHVYFFVVPMGMGDAYFGLGDFASAEREYLAAASYAFLTAVEAFKVWSRLAELYLEWGDLTYRQGGDDPAAWPAAAALYARIVRRDKTVDPASPLYAAAGMAALKTRVEAAASAANPATLVENPALVAAVLSALARFTQIDAGLNFLGFPPDYLPPFTFEYLQNTARYLAQQAARLEQLYVSFKSHAEAEQLSRDQLAQQVEVARATVALEERNRDEAQAGVRTAQASQAYAQTQISNAVAANNEFAAVRWELLEYAEAQAWSSAAAVDEDDEVQQTWNGHYYNAQSKNRSDVLQDLAYRQTRIGQDLEASRLAREVTSAQAYKAVADAQVAQAQARVAVADQRVAIANLQASYAADNLSFVDHKEFGSRAWYEMARWLRGIAARYFDMAVSAAFLMERAYFLETGRDLRRIRFEAQGPGRGVLAGELLAADIDSFTQDFLATTQSRKAPVKQRLSFADDFPYAFDQLKRTGACQFATTFDHFHRGYPGLWLAKLRSVEVVFVGVTGATGIKGTLRTIGVSEHRTQAGDVLTLAGVADVLPLSVFDARQDTLLFRVDPNALRVFENCGVATAWRLELPLDANDFDYRELLDIQLVLYFDAFYDPALEAATRAALPAGGSASRAIPASLYWPDELYYLRNRREGRFAFSADSFPRLQTALTRTRVVIRLVGDAAAVAGLHIRLASSELGTAIAATTDGDGAVDSAAPGSPLAALVGRPVLDTWTLSVTADDNPGRFPDGDPSAPGITDAIIVLAYSFTYRTAP